MKVIIDCFGNRWYKSVVGFEPGNASRNIANESLT